jgi:carbonic anhydrase/acetyltransferase-like protein (isoleucine patch superfamily)
MKRCNPNKKYPQVHKTAFIDSTAVIIGDVKIGKNVFVAPGAVIRADEPKSLIIIGDNCNIQDRVVIHAFSRSRVVIGKNTSLSHGCIVHGPSKIGRNCFIGFSSVVFNAEIKDSVCVKHLTVVEGVRINSGRVIESCSLVNCEKHTKDLRACGGKEKDFMEKVVKANLCLRKGYKNEQGSILR